MNHGMAWWATCLFEEIHILLDNSLRLTNITIEFKGMDLVSFHILLEKSKWRQTVDYFFASSPFSMPALSTPPFCAAMPSDETGIIHVIKKHFKEQVKLIRICATHPDNFFNLNCSFTLHARGVRKKNERVQERRFVCLCMHVEECGSFDRSPSTILPSEEKGKVWDAESVKYSENIFKKKTQ